jgi:hypothetical protein
MSHDPDGRKGHSRLSLRRQSRDGIRRLGQSFRNETENLSGIGRFPLIAVTGYLFGVAGFYTNFLGSILAATALLVDLTGLVFIAWILAAIVRARSFRRTRIARSLIVAGSVCTILMILMTLVAFNPPSAARQSGEACGYDVGSSMPDAISIPLNPGGSISEEVRVPDGRIVAVSPIVGLDQKIASLSNPHPLKLILRSPDGSVDVRLQIPDIVNNRYSRFNLPHPIDAGNADVFMVKIVNESTDPVGVYVKKPDQSDYTDGPIAGIFVDGQRSQPGPYRRSGFALSGCVAQDNG